MRIPVHILCFAAAMTVSAVCSASAGERYGYDGYGGYGFADEGIGGDFIGAPFTQFPRPSALVPSAWGYGTYGVPTVAGIRQAPTATPTLTVINADASPLRRTGRGPRILSRGADERGTSSQAGELERSGIRVVSVTVPRR